MACEIKRTETGFCIEIPEEVIENLGLEEGQEVEFFTDEGRIVMLPVVLGADMDALEEDIESDPELDQMYRNLARR